MAPNCPWCKETVADSEWQAGKCPHCDSSLADSDGRELRDIDLRYDRVEADQQRRFRELLIYGSVVVAIFTFVMPMMHVGVALITPLLVVAHMLAVKVFLIRQARALLGTRRRIFTRWIARFAFLWIGLPGYGSSAVPLIGVVISVATFAGLTAIVHSYTLWSLERERQRAPLALWEKLVMVSLAVITAALLIFLVCAVIVLGWSVAWLYEYATTNWG